jgi:hypothetical protein
MVDDQNAGKVIRGSSPEIHNVGIRGNTHFMRRAQSNARGFPSNARSTNYSDEKVSNLGVFIVFLYKVKKIYSNMFSLSILHLTL